MSCAHVRADTLERDATVNQKNDLTPPTRPVDGRKEDPDFFPYSSLCAHRVLDALMILDICAAENETKLHTKKTPVLMPGS